MESQKFEEKKKFPPVHFNLLKSPANPMLHKCPKVVGSIWNKNNSIFCYVIRTEASKNRKQRKKTMAIGGAYQINILKLICLFFTVVGIYRSSGRIQLNMWFKWIKWAIKALNLVGLLLLTFKMEHFSIQFTFLGNNHSQFTICICVYSPRWLLAFCGFSAGGHTFIAIVKTFQNRKN